MASHENITPPHTDSTVEPFIGQKFGLYTIINIERQGRRGMHVWCVCACGTPWNGMFNRLRSRHRTSCGCRKREKPYMVGEKFGYLTILALRYESSSSPAKSYIGKAVPIVRCQCDCGNICDKPWKNVKAGIIVSCGCMHHHVSRARDQEMIGQTFGQLTVTAIYSEGGQRLADCVCICTNSHTVSISNLRAGKVRSCGCLFQAMGIRQRKDYTGARFGKLIVLAMDWSGKSALCHCRCDCGNECQVKAGHLVSNQTTTCGCLRRSSLQRKRMLKRLNVDKRRDKYARLPQTLTALHIDFMFQYWDFSCCVCGNQEGFSWRLALDHWIPIDSDACPGTTPTNIVPLCQGVGGCNNSKGAMVPGLWLSKKLGNVKAKKKLKEIETYFAAAKTFAEAQKKEQPCIAS
jgi:hypothetical protein